MMSSLSKHSAIRIEIVVFKILGNLFNQKQNHLYMLLVILLSFIKLLSPL